MKTLKYNGEQWYIDKRSAWKRCRQWLVWVGGWEKPNGTGWELTIGDGNRKRIMNPTPISFFGNRITIYCWGLCIERRAVRESE